MLYLIEWYNGHLMANRHYSKAAVTAGFGLFFKFPYNVTYMNEQRTTNSQKGDPVSKSRAQKQNW